MTKQGSGAESFVNSRNRNYRGGKTSEKTEDKAMYDAREKAIRDYQSAINSADYIERNRFLNQLVLEGQVPVS